MPINISANQLVSLLGCENYTETDCERTAGLYLININKKHLVHLSCKAYKCPVCGPRKAHRLQDALLNLFNSYEHIRLFTFTYRTSVFCSVEECYEKSSEIWRRFITYMRRTKTLSESQRNFNFVKVVEFTKAGYIHYHVFVDSYLPWKICQSLWLAAIESVMCKGGKNGHVNIKHSFSAEGAANYVAKYVLKSALEKKNNIRIWSRSAGFVLFTPSEHSHEYEFLSLRNSKLNLSLFSVSSHASVTRTWLDTYTNTVELTQNDFTINDISSTPNCLYPEPCLSP
jgi:hypothetical protein